MVKKDLTLHKRVEEIREPQKTAEPLQFSLKEIKKHFDDTLCTIINEYEIADELTSAGKNEEAKTIWRSQIVFLEGLLDFYMHEISKYGLYRMFCGTWEKSEKYKYFKIPMMVVEGALLSLESQEWFFKYLNETLSNQVFLAAESMRDQLNLIGIGFTEAMHVAFAKATENESHEYGKKVIANLFKRRNIIAHQNDRDHASAEQNDISKEFVEEARRNIESIVNAIHNIAEENDKESIPPVVRLKTTVEEKKDR